jgi:hypothetical protein
MLWMPNRYERTVFLLRGTTNTLSIIGLCVVMLWMPNRYERTVMILKRDAGGGDRLRGVPCGVPCLIAISEQGLK